MTLMFDVPTSLSPSRVESFLSCPMAFRFSSIEQLPEPPAEHTTKGSLVHRALELLFTEPNDQRDRTAARLAFDRAVAEFRTDPEFTGLRLDAAQADAFVADAWVLVEKYFDMEDPRAVRDIGLELRLAASVGGLELRGIIDRLAQQPVLPHPIDLHQLGVPPRHQQRHKGKLRRVLTQERRQQVALQVMNSQHRFA